MVTKPQTRYSCKCMDPVHESQERTKKKLDTVEKELTETRQRVTALVEMERKIATLTDMIEKLLDKEQS